MAKSPFAVKSYETYRYPAPLDATEIAGEKVPEALLEARADLIDPEVMADNDRPWVKLRIPRSKADLDTIADLTQSLTQLDSEGASLMQRVARGNRGVFETLVDSWAWDREPNAAAFDELDLWASDWISACMADALRRGQERGYGKKKTTEPSDDSSPPPESSVGRSPEEQPRESESS